LISHEFLLLKVFVPDVAVVTTSWITCADRAYTKSIAAGSYGQYTGYAGYAGSVGADCTNTDNTAVDQYAGSVGSNYASLAGCCRTDVGSYDTISDQYAGSVGLQYANLTAGASWYRNYTCWIGQYGLSIDYDCT
jgi:hypothetical protein